MKLCIFGASGKTGQVLLDKALAAGHEATAFVRDPARLSLRHDRLRAVVGDIREAASVEAAVAGQDVVVSALGQTRPPTPGLLAQGVENIVNAMKKHGVRRLLYLTGAGVPDPGDAPSLPRTLIRTLMKLVSPAVLRDSESAFQIIRSSDLDWVVVRAPILSDRAAGAPVQVTFTPPGPVKIARTDVAEFMLAQANNDSYLRRAPMLTYSPRREE